MPNIDSPQGIYAPLRQNLTDSESEDDVHSNMNRKANLHMKLNGFCDSNIIGEGTEVVIHNQMVSDGDEPNGNTGVFSDADNITILDDFKGRRGMSPLRKLCFITSLLVCVATVIIFLWVIPCDDSCRGKIERFKTHNWNREYENIELKGMINVVKGLKGRSENLVFMYRGDQIFPDNKKAYRTVRRNGIISVLGSLGEVAWYDEMLSEPTNIDCNLLDVDRNGSPDCLVTDEFGQLGCINPISGQWLWHFHDSENVQRKGDLLDFPLILPDMNSDRVNELLLASSLSGSTHNSLVMISGGTGRILGKPYTVTECSYIHKLQIDNKFTISFNCINKETEFEKFKELPELYSLMMNETLNPEILNTKKNIDQHKFYGQRKNTENQRNLYSLSGKQLIVENRGRCPENCSVTITLFDQKNDKDYMLCNSSSMYGMVPALLSFNSTNIDGKSTVHGFVIKFWEWSTNETDLKIQRSKREIYEPLDDEFNVFGNILMKRKKWTLPDLKSNRKTRDVNDNLTKETLINSKMRLLKETIVLIVFNSTDTRIVNTSQSNIIQFCQENHCQPDLNYQENSLLVADLDKDGSQELVSYYTSFTKNNDNLENSYKLVTYVQLLRLEAELPKLYSTDYKN